MICGESIGYDATHEREKLMKCFSSFNKKYMDRGAIMNENQNYEQPEEIIISFQKLWDNFKKYWWICVITTVLAVVAVIGLTVKNYHDAKNLSENDLVENEDKLYQATTMVYMEPQLEKMSESIKETADNIQDLEKSYAASVNEYVKTYIEQWNWNRNNQLMYDSMALLSSNRVRSQINDALEKNGMDSYDRILDEISMEIASGSRYYKLIVRGEDEERVEFIANTATDILLKEAQNVMGITNGRLIDKASIDLCEKQADGTYKIITEKSELEAEEEEATLSLGSFISMKNLLLIFVGAFFGLGIIFIFVLMDKKLRNRNEVNMYLHIPYLGEVSKKSGDAQYSVLTTTLRKKCEQEGIKKVLLTTPKVCDIQEKLLKNLGNESESTATVKIDSTTNKVEEKIAVEGTGKELTVVSAGQLLESSNTIKAVSSVDGTVLLITANGDNIPELEETISHIRTVGGKILGYVLYR